MDYTTQLRIGEIVRNLIEDGETFSRDAATELLTLLPPEKQHAFAINCMSQGLSGGFSGLTSTGHSARIDDDEVKSFSTEKPAVWAGKMALRRDDQTRGRTTVSIEDRFRDTRDLGEDPSSWKIDYRHGAPVQMRRENPRIFRIAFGSSRWSFRFATFARWKVPA